jgi:hypothetical protein
MQINRCPKCGQEPILAEECAIEFSLGWLVECFHCGLHTRRYETRDEAVTKWNALTEAHNG